jgi:O-antigen ligase
MIGSLVIVWYAKFPNKRLLIFIFAPSTLITILTTIFQRLFLEGSETNSIDNINFNGRLLIWAALLENTSLYFGNGIGSSVDFIAKNYIEVGIQPHNDYLRIYHDSGLFGLGLIGTFFYLIINGLRKKIVANKNLNSAHIFSLAGFISFGIIMLTDNVFIYSFYFFPLLIFYFLSMQSKYD